MIDTHEKLLAHWRTGVGKPYKGQLIDDEAYTKFPFDPRDTSPFDPRDPSRLGCMCAQGQLLHILGGWSIDDLMTRSQDEADRATAQSFDISKAHAVLLRFINDRIDGAPEIVLTDPGKVLGDQWSKVLDFWCHLDGMSAATIKAIREKTVEGTEATNKNGGEDGGGGSGGGSRRAKR
ncbi:MAG: hypothetical protein U5N55_04975 [Cypionkella sp.]|nr:hypothetical protein [Cypionkella sp.]